jgi:molybdopterin-guanine dinucleotide biosynthesis protein A
MSDPMRSQELAAAILAGGRSRRMGRNKALIQIDGRTMIEKMANLALQFSDRVYISSNESLPYRFLRLPVVPDIYSDQGPLAGLHAVMTRSERPLLLLLAIDLPRIHDRLIRFLVDSASQEDILVPRTSDGWIHPLCGIYRRSCLETVERNLRRGFNRVQDLLQDPGLRVRVLEGDEWPFPASDLMNLNEPGSAET